MNRRGKRVTAYPYEVTYYDEDGPPTGWEVRVYKVPHDFGQFVWRWYVVGVSGRTVQEVHAGYWTREPDTARERGEAWLRSIVDSEESARRRASFDERAAKRDAHIADLERALGMTP